MRPEALIFAGRELLDGWTVMDRLGEIAVPTLVLAGRDDFLFPPEHQAALAAGIPGAQLRIVECAGHNPHEERTAEVLAAVRTFIATGAGVPPEEPTRARVGRSSRAGRDRRPAGGGRNPTMMRFMPDDPGRFFASHPGLYRMSLAAAGGTAVYAAARSVREAGRRRMPWMALAILQAAIVAGMVHRARGLGMPWYDAPGDR